MLDARAYRAGDVIFSEGNQGSFVHVVADGHETPNFALEVMRVLADPQRRHDPAS